MLVAGLAAPASARSSFAPTPTTPAYNGVPGALPPHFVYVYDSTYRGWPIAPTHVQSPVRGAFLDPRGPDDTGLSGYHFGIDVSIDDRHPDAAAPAGLSHQVYAVESGRVSEPSGVRTRSCSARRLQVGHFAYWHVSPTVAARAYVKAGKQIGWSCLGVWHVHLSEWQRFHGRQVWVNPLHRGGRIAPYVDTALPVVNALVFVTPPARPWLPTTTLAQPDSSTPLARGRLHGLVELRANIGDPQSFLGFLANKRAWPTVFTPYRLSVTIRAIPTGKVVMRRTSFQADQLPQTPYIVHYAPGTIEDDNMQECVGPPRSQPAPERTGSDRSPSSGRSTGTPARHRTAATRSPFARATWPETPRQERSKSRCETRPNGQAMPPGVIETGSLMQRKMTVLLLDAIKLHSFGLTGREPLLLMLAAPARESG